MEQQLFLPAAWASETAHLRRREPSQALEHMARDKHEAMAEIRTVLDFYAERHGVPERNVDEAVRRYVDDMLSDLFFEVEEEMTRGVVQTR